MNTENMEKITISEYYALIASHHPELLTEDWQYGLYDEGDEGVAEAVSCFRTEGCAVMFDSRQWTPDRPHTIECNIHELCDDADYVSVCRRFYDMMQKEASKHEGCRRSFMLFHPKPLTEKLNEYWGWRVFMHEPIGLVVCDMHVSELTRDDLDDIKRMCDVVDDTGFGKISAGSFAGYDFDFNEQYGTHIIGYRDGGELCGLATWNTLRPSGLGFLEEIYVPPKFRRRGVATALVTSAISNLPDRKWVYQAARDNAPSIAFARSLGFGFAGAQLALIFDWD